MSEMWKHTCPTVKCGKQARLLLVPYVRLALLDSDSHQMVYRAYGIYLLGLVDGNHQEISGKGLCLEEQALVLRTEENLLLPRLLLQL